MTQARRECRECGKPRRPEATYCAECFQRHCEADPPRARTARYRVRHTDRVREQSRAYESRRPKRDERAYRRARLALENDRRRTRLTDPVARAHVNAQRCIYRKREHVRIQILQYLDRRYRNATGAHTAQEWLEKVALFGGCCAYCGEAKPLTRDHNVPLIRGGTNDIGNIIPACLVCNCRKGRRTAAEFMAAA